MSWDHICRTMYHVLMHLKRYERLKTYIYTSKKVPDEVIESYKVEIVEDGEYEQIYIWNQSKQRVLIDLDKKEEYAVLNPVCPNPESTKEMIIFALDFLKKRGVKKVQMDDRASVDCNGEKISLSLIHFFKYGETWYEDNFGFKPTSEYLDEYNIVKKNRKDLLVVDNLRNAPSAVFTHKNMMIFLRKVHFEFYGSIVWEKTL